MEGDGETSQGDGSLGEGTVSTLHLLDRQRLGECGMSGA